MDKAGNSGASAPGLRLLGCGQGYHNIITATNEHEAFGILRSSGTEKMWSPFYGRGDSRLDDWKTVSRSGALLVCPLPPTLCEWD
jgi:hypothetical protein